MMEGEDEEAVKVPTLTKETLRGWQKAILEVRFRLADVREHVANWAIAPLDSRSAEITFGIPVSGSYE